jgi:hypothetical protein
MNAHELLTSLTVFSDFVFFSLTCRANNIADYTRKLVK